MAAESVVSSVLGQLGNLLKQEVNFLSGVSGQVEQMQRELKLMRSYLEDADKRQDENKTLQAWVSEIREAAYDAQNVIETYVLKVASRRRGGIQNTFKRYACILGEAVEIHKVGSDITAIMSRISNLNRSKQDYGIKPKSEDEGSSSAQPLVRRTYSHVVEEYAVGLDGDVEKLVAPLVNEIHKVSSEIEAIKTRISDLRSSLQNNGIGPRSDGEGSSSTLIRARQNLRRVYSDIVEEYTVGLDGAVKDLVALLVNEEKPCGVVSICGMGGLGKTTLAKKIYHHSDIRRHFDGFTWASVSQQFQPRNIWEGILIGLISPSEQEREKIVKLRDEELVRKLHEVQLHKKFLVILDDVWTTQAWNRLRPAFPLVENTGSKVLLTTRNKTVAEHADPRGFLYEPLCLNEEERWELLRTKAFPKKDDPDFKIDTEKEKLGKEMVRRCKGLPPAIGVLGGILARKNALNDWNMVLENIKLYSRRGEGHDQQHSGVYEVLALSYHELPYKLKPCFLHLGHFPKDFNIPAKKLYKLWLAEGIVSPSQYEVEEEESLEDVAKCYLDELIQRSMVQVGEKGSTGTVKTCRLHDLMHDFCLLKAKQENFLKNVHLREQKEQVDSLSSMATTTNSTSQVRRLAIHLSKESLEFFPQQIITPYVQSLLFFDPFYTNISQKMISKFSNFKSLRVLDFNNCKISGKLPKAIGNLVHLRYLSLNFSKITSISSSLGNLRFLQTLILVCWGINDYRIWVPNVIWKMEQLRHLCLSINIHGTKGGKLQLGNLSNLLTLEGFDTRHFDVKELTNLRNLRKLRIEECKSLKEFEGILISPNASLNRLRSLCIRRIESEVEETDLQGLFSGRQQLYKLFVCGKIRKLPEYPQFPPNLSKLILWESKLEEDPMPTLEKLPNLTILRLSFNAFAGKEMVCSSKGFPQLKSLVLAVLPNLEEWSVSDEAMPTLCQLEIWRCSELKMIPDGLRFITTLQQLKIFNMPEAFKRRVRAVNGGGEDSDKVQHVPSIIIAED